MIDTTMAKKVSVIILGLTPLFFLPVAQNYYDTNKWMLLATGALIVLICWAVELFRTKIPLKPSIPTITLGFGALTLASVVSLFIGSTNKIEALLSPIGPATFFFLTILIIAASAPKPNNVLLRRVLYAVMGLIALTSFYQVLGIGKLMFPRVAFLADPLWTPTGSVATTIALFLITLSLLIPDTIAALKKRQEYDTIALLVIVLLVIVVGAGITIVQFIPKISAMLPFDVGMVVASQVFKIPTLTVVGVGAENFITAFTVARPASLNTTPLAGIAFGTNADFFLHILTTCGLTGLAAALVLVGTLLTGNKRGWPLITKCLCILGLLLIPPTIPLLAIIAIVLILSRDRDTDTKAPKPVAVPAWIRVFIGVLVILTAVTGFYFLIRAYTADIFFSESLLAAQNNDGTKTYNLQIQAIEMNTFLSSYHISYGQTSLALANSIGASFNESTGSAQDRQLMAQLLQQAVKEAKTAVSLNPQNVAAWENLGLTYQTIMPVSTEAAGWALTADQSAVQLDPSNPTLFVNIGNVFVAQKQYDNAIILFERAIQLNPSYANAYYNLANVYKLKGDTINEAKALTATLKLVQPGSTDYAKVQNDLNDIPQAATSAAVQNAPATGIPTLPMP